MSETSEVLKELKNELQSIHTRNKRVETDKAWEKSTTRKVVICIITYLTASTVMYIIGVKDFYYGALIPVVGFLLSTLSLPEIKKWWIKQHIK